MNFLYSARLFPNIYVSKSPFKIFEYRHLTGLTRFSGTELVLDLGCGSGLQTCCLARKARKVIGLDICDLAKAEEKGRRIRSRFEVEFIHSRLQDASFPNGTFDRIFSFCVIEHILEFREILQKCCDLLKSPGELILSVDSLAAIPSKLKKIHEKDHAVSHYFMSEELRSLLQELPFSEVDVHSLLRSGLAAKMFCRGIQSRFSYSISGAVLRWFALCVSESLCRRSGEGVFLAARCRK